MSLWFILLFLIISKNTRMQDSLGNDEMTLHNSQFLRACRREKTGTTPIWMMRQAGRYQAWYRKLRETVSFLEMCKRPELAAEVTVKAAEQLGTDAAILFADILLIVEPMGVGLTFNQGEGPSIARPVRTRQNVDALHEVEPTESLGFVFEAIRMTRRSLPANVPLIGFCGAPFTVASYMIEGGKSREFRNTKTFMHADPGAWHALMDSLVRASADSLNGQVRAGAFQNVRIPLGHGLFRDAVAGGVGYKKPVRPLFFRGFLFELVADFQVPARRCPREIAHHSFGQGYAYGVDMHIVPFQVGARRKEDCLSPAEFPFDDSRRGALVGIRGYDSRRTGFLFASHLFRDFNGGRKELMKADFLYV